MSELDQLFGDMNLALDQRSCGDGISDPAATVLIVGAGPAGLFAASELLRHIVRHAGPRCSRRCFRRSTGPGWSNRSSAPAKMTAPVDVLIIGEGASGAAVAWSRAETKMHILCLEPGDG